jgi:hypothetical protein
LRSSYTEITNISGNTGKTIQPSGVVFDSTPNDPIVNGTSFVVIVSNPLYVTPYNLSLINDCECPRPDASFIPDAWLTCFILSSPVQSLLPDLPSTRLARRVAPSSLTTCS